MNKTLLYVIIAVVVIGGVGFFLMNQPVSTNTDQATPQSLKELLASQNPQQCAFDQSTEGAAATGKVFVSNGKMRGDFTSLVNNQGVESHMIVRDNTAYVWSSLANQGFKMSTENMMNGTTTSVDMNQRFDYTCSGWTEDSTAFTLPTTITFSDMSAMMDQMMVSSSATVNQCGLCDKIPDAAAKAQCRTSLNCK